MRDVRSIIASIFKPRPDRYPLRAIAAVVYVTLIIGGLVFLFLFTYSVHSLPILLLVSLILLRSVFEEIRVFVRVRSKWEKQTRAAANLCQKCGYDLRASADRCPECGTKVTLSKANAVASPDPLEIKVQLIVSRVLMAAGPTIGLGLWLGKETGLVYVGWIAILCCAIIVPLFLSISWARAELAWRRHRQR